MRKTRALRLVPEPRPGTPGLVVPVVPGPLVTRDGPFDYACGRCGYVLIKAMAPAELRSAVIKCFRCKACNATAPARA